MSVLSPGAKQPGSADVLITERKLQCPLTFQDSNMVKMFISVFKNTFI